MSRSLLLVLLAACAPAPPGEDVRPPDTDAAHTDLPDDTDGEVPWVGAPSLQLRRLSRAQLDRAVHDLLGVDAGAAALLPDDPDGAGFDATAATLGLPPTTLAAWRVAVERAATAATLPPQVRQEIRPGADADATDGVETLADAWVLPVHAGLTATVEAPVHGAYVLRLVADWPAAEPVPVEPPLDVDGARVVWAPGTPGTPFGQRSFHSLPVELAAGQHAVFVHNPGASSSLAPLVVQEIGLDGPTPAHPAEAWTAWVPCAPDASLASWRACAAEALTPLARRAWRRPVAAAELDRLLGHLDEAHAAGMPFHAGLRRAVEHLLLSPHFLFRVEAHDGATPVVDDLVLASRLAFFLWSSVPDDTLLDLALQGRLSTPEVLAAQVDRMLADPHSEGLVQDFAGQWLGFRELGRVSLDPTLFPEWTPALAAAMQAETATLARQVLRGERPLPELLTAAESHVDDVLAAHYGVAAGPAVDVRAARGGGLLGHGAVQVATSHATRTSVVKRGEWVLGALLCTSVGPPPGEIPPAPNTGDPRQDAAEHAARPQCAQCHDELDPPGLAMEHFGPSGRWRDAYPSGTLVDASATLEDGTDIYGTRELAEALAADPRFPRCATHSLATWALGRPLDVDDPALDEVHAAFEASGWRLPALVRALVLHPVFRAPLEQP